MKRLKTAASLEQIQPRQRRKTTQEYPISNTEYPMSKGGSRFALAVSFIQWTGRNNVMIVKWRLKAHLFSVITHLWLWPRAIMIMMVIKGT
jgi:hypothetical protein